MFIVYRLRRGRGQHAGAHNRWCDRRSGGLTCDNNYHDCPVSQKVISVIVNSETP